MELILLIALATVILLSVIVVNTKDEREEETDTEKTLERLALIRKHLYLIDSDHRQGKITDEQYEAEKTALWHELDEIEEEICRRDGYVSPEIEEIGKLINDFFGGK